jgi:hypothetical protein
MLKITFAKLCIKMFMATGVTNIIFLIDIVYTVFKERVLLKQYPVLSEEGLSWLPTSPDLIPCDYFLQGYWKDEMFKKNQFNSRIKK